MKKISLLCVVEITFLSKPGGIVSGNGCNFSRAMLVVTHTAYALWVSRPVEPSRTVLGDLRGRGPPDTVTQEALF